MHFHENFAPILVKEKKKKITNPLSNNHISKKLSFEITTANTHLNPPKNR